MPVRRRYRPSGAMMVALLALFFSLGGFGYAKRAVALIDGHHIKKGSIEANRLSKHARAALKGARGPKGEPGPASGRAGGNLTGSYPNPSIAAGAVTDVKVAAANKDGAANVPSLRTLGTGGLQAMPGNAQPGGPPSGNAGGGLSGSYPNPSIATGAVGTPDFAPGATAPNASTLGGQAPSAFAQSSLFGSPPTANQGGTGDSSCMLSEIKLMAGDVLASNWTLAQGQLLTISSNTALFTLLGTTYGGNGTTNFALPDLRGAEPKGRGPAGVNYIICTTGIFP